MEKRKQAILRAVVHEFTTSAVPVGSQALQSRYFVNLSSATIRSELAELADLVSLEPKEVLLILLLEGNLLRQQVVNTTEPATQANLTKLAARFNGSLAGHASDEARRHYDAALLGLEKELLGRVIAVLDLYEKGSESLVVHDGVRNLLRQPEFAESSRLHQVLEVLEETRYLTVLLRQLIGESELQIVIGSENASSQLQGCAVVLTTYGPTDRLKGVLGVIGPTRMAYSHTVGRCDAVARGASDRMAELAGH